MHKISFKMTLQDRYEEFRVSLASASLSHQAVRYGYVLLFLIDFVLILYALLLSCYHQYHPVHWPTLPWPPRPFPSILGWLVGISFGYNIFWSAVLDSSRSVWLFPEHIVFKRRLTSNVIGWQDVTALSNTGGYIYVWFCQDAPNAIAVPKLAFSTSQGAEAFYAVLLEYWWSATGVRPSVVLDAAGIWPPAPRPSNSAEPGDTL